MNAQDSGMNDVMNRGSEGNDTLSDASKDFPDSTGYEDSFDDEDGGNSFRGGRGGRGNFRWDFNSYMSRKLHANKLRFRLDIMVLNDNLKLNYILIYFV